MSDWVEVHRGGDRSRWLEHALVLAALDIDHWLLADGHGFCLLVPSGEVQRARRELTEYEAESRAAAPTEPEATEAIAGASRFVPGYAVVLLSFFAFERHWVFGFDWLEAGRAQAHLIRQGEWWRTVTALTLHADGSHLLNNLVFGALFGILLAQEVGVARAWLGLVLTGSLANGLNAWIHTPEHASIGASSGVFGVVGLLMGLQGRKPGAVRRGRLRRWAPAVAGAVFLGLLGTSGVRTDVMAHLSGVAVGLTLGWPAGGMVTPGRPDGGRHSIALLALCLVGASWWLALPLP